MSNEPTEQPVSTRDSARQEASEAIYAGRANTVRALLLMAGVRRVNELAPDQLDTFRQALALAQRPPEGYDDRPTLQRRVTSRTRKLTLRIR